MTSTALNSTATRALPLDKILVGISFVLGLATILGAWGSQLFGGLVPCELCLEQRMAYYWGLPVLALVLILWNRLPLPVWYAAVAIGAAIFAWSTYMAGYHAGVEWGFWPGPTACTGSAPAGGSAQDLLKQLETVQIVRCDQVALRILGLSLAGWNAILSAGFAAAAASAARRAGLGR